jgi:DNA-3-methyladenine glycosylase
LKRNKQQASFAELASSAVGASTLQRLNLPMLAPLARRFYEPSAAQIAPKLLGHFLIRNTASGPCGGVIVEAEAYLTDDPACHAFNGETARNRSMFGPPGHAYVYFIYGNHWCVNVVCRPKGHGEAVLIRAMEPVVGEEWMRTRRSASRTFELTNGPGKLCAALEIDRALDGADLCDAASSLWIARNPARAAFVHDRGPLAATPRIGITRAAELPLRFYLAGSPFVSRRSARDHSRAVKQGIAVL